MNYIQKKLSELKINFSSFKSPTLDPQAEIFQSFSLHQRGNYGEMLAIKWLEEQNYKLVKHGYNTRFGEIDIIVAKDEVIAFVEVKMRNKNYFDLSQVITASKQQKIIKSAHDFISRNYMLSANYIFRFDVALLELINGNYQLNYIPNAFTDEPSKSWC